MENGGSISKGLVEEVLFETSCGGLRYWEGEEGDGEGEVGNVLGGGRDSDQLSEH